jgi:SAM-dependent methyltransferase
MLDMGTGGGEFLATLTPLPKNTYATESYVPNVPIAKKKLEPLGVKVVKTDSDENLPFDDEKFELVMNRHEAFSATEVYRVLRPSGCFITQQVGRKNNIELNKLLQKKLHGKIEYGYQNWDLDSARQTLVASGFRVSESKEEFPETEFYDVAAVIYYLKAIPWQIPDFSVQRYHIQLKEIHDSIEKDGKLKTTAHRFYVVAHKK